MVVISEYMSCTFGHTWESFTDTCQYVEVIWLFVLEHRGGKGAETCLTTYAQRGSHGVTWLSVEAHADQSLGRCDQRVSLRGGIRPIRIEYWFEAWWMPFLVREISRLDKIIGCLEGYSSWPHCQQQLRKYAVCGEREREICSMILKFLRILHSLKAEEHLSIQK